MGAGAGREEWPGLGGAKGLLVAPRGAAARAREHARAHGPRGRTVRTCERRRRRGAGGRARPRGRADRKAGAAMLLPPPLYKPNGTFARSTAPPSSAGAASGATSDGLRAEMSAVEAERARVAAQLEALQKTYAEDKKEILTFGRDAAATNASLKQRLAEAEAKVAAGASQKAALDAQLAAAKNCKDELADARRAQGAAEAEAAELRGRQSAAEARAREVDADRREAIMRADAAKDKADEARAELANARGTVNRLEDELADARRKLREADVRLAAATARADAAEAGDSAARANAAEAALVAAIKDKETLEAHIHEGRHAAAESAEAIEQLQAEVRELNLVWARTDRERGEALARASAAESAREKVSSLESQLASSQLEVREASRRLSELKAEAAAVPLLRSKLELVTAEREAHVQALESAGKEKSELSEGLSKRLAALQEEAQRLNSKLSVEVGRREEMEGSYARLLVAAQAAKEHFVTTEEERLRLDDLLTRMRARANDSDAHAALTMAGPNNTASAAPAGMDVLSAMGAVRQQMRGAVASVLEVGPAGAAAMPDLYASAPTGARLVASPVRGGYMGLPVAPPTPKPSWFA